MCFSATASFVAGSALVVVGIVTTSKVKKRRERAFASIPLLFGIQQLLEGIVWISFGTPALNAFASYGYAYFAYVLWPMFVPLAVLATEQDPKRKKLLQAFALLGIGVGLFALYLISSGPVTARIINRCIRYDMFYPYPLSVVYLYLLATCGSFMASSRPFIKAFGLAILISSAIAAWFYIETFSSVWCFFAAILSAMIYWHYRGK